MDNVKILAVGYRWVDRQIPAMELHLEFDSPDGKHHVTAVVSEVRPLALENGFVLLQGKTELDRFLLRTILSLKTVENEKFENLTDNSAILKLTHRFLTDLNENRFIEGDVGFLTEEGSA